MSQVLVGTVTDGASPIIGYPVTSATLSTNTSGAGAYDFTIEAGNHVLSWGGPNHYTRSASVYLAGGLATIDLISRRIVETWDSSYSFESPGIAMQAGVAYHI